MLGGGCRRGRVVCSSIAGGDPRSTFMLTTKPILQYRSRPAPSTKSFRCGGTSHNSLQLPSNSDWIMQLNAWVLRRRPTTGVYAFEFPPFAVRNVVCPRMEEAPCTPLASFFPSLVTLQHFSFAIACSSSTTTKWCGTIFWRACKTCA